MYSASKINVLIVGPTGSLGCNIVDRCIERPNLNVSILCRDPSACGELCTKIKNAGGTCVKGDLSKPETLKDACKNIHTIISTVEGDETLYLEGQEALLKAAVECGVKRFVPSDFTLDYRMINEDEHPVLRSKLKLRKLISDSIVRGLHIFCGVFYEKIFEFYKYGVFFYETMEKKISLIAQDDVARFTAAAVSQPDKFGDICISGDQMSLREIVDMYNSIKNVNVPVAKIGNIEDLKQAIQKTRTQSDLKRSYILGYILLMTEGKATLKDLNNNQFPDIKPVKLEQFIKDHQELKLGEQGISSFEKQPTDNIFSGLIITGKQTGNIC